jgi:transcriptional regulator with XRE-family HTH domain
LTFVNWRTDLATIRTIACLGEETDRGGIGARVRAGRRRLGWTREVLAARSGLSWSAVAQVESGRRTNLRPATLAGLAGALGVTIDYLVDGGAVKRPLLVHRALIYDGEESFADLVAPFLAEGVSAAEATVAVTTPEKIALLRDRLGATGEQVDFCDSAEVYTTPANAIAHYHELIQRRLDEGAAWVRMAGEPLWNGDAATVRAWTRYESILNLAIANSPATLVCPYDARALDAEIVGQAHATHPETITAAGVAASETYADPAQFAISG